MYQRFSLQDVLSSSTRAAWRIEGVLPQGAVLDFARDFVPEPLSRIVDIAPTFS